MVAPVRDEDGIRWLGPQEIAPVVRGCRNLAWGEGALRFCRLPAQPIVRYPVDSWQRAHQSAGIRLGFTTDAEEWSLRLRHPSWEEGARTVVRVEGVERAIAHAQREVHLRIASGAGSVDVYLPPMAETEIAGIGLPARASFEPAGAPAITWLAYGDSITQGEGASDGAHTYVEGVRRRLGLGSRLEPLNVGLSGAARGEYSVAQALAQMPCDLITVSMGTNVYGQGCYDGAAWREVLRNFLAILRTGHPSTPLLVISPIWRAVEEAESTPNARGLTHRDLRRITEEVVLERVQEGDSALTLVGGLELLGVGEAGLSRDGLHPSDSGMDRMAERLTPAIRKLVERLLARRGEEKGGSRL